MFKQIQQEQLLLVSHSPTCSIIQETSTAPTKTDLHCEIQVQSRNMKTPTSKVKLTTKLSNNKFIRKMSSQSIMRDTRRTSLPLCCMILLQMALVWVATVGPRTSDAYATSSNYDPEQQDGIPILSARSLNPLPADDWLNGDTDNERQSAQRAQRRNSDSDLDDGVDDDDDDEYQSGSSKHEMVEPSFGESKKAAKDGDEIESFFDKHLGPPPEVGSGEEASEEMPIQSMPAAAAAAAAARPLMTTLTATTSDPDEYEAAASSPLSSIFQSLLSGHRKPFVIHATEEVDSSPASSSTSSASSSKTTEKPDGKDTLGSSSSLRGSALATNHYMQQVAPIAFHLTPIASPSSIDSYESSANDAGQPDDGPQAPVREIYIGRRPAVAKYIQQASSGGGGYSASNPRGTYGGGGQASGQVWRNSPMMYHPATGGRGHVDHSDYQQSMDYSRYPVAASYAYQREQAHPAEAAAAAPDDGQTVTYGLSFGGSSAADEANEPEPAAPAGGDSTAASNQADDEAGQQQAPMPYMPYNDREFMRYKTASTRAYNNYQNGAMNVPAGYMRIPQNQAAYIHQQRQYQQQHQPRQSPYHGSRYHRDPSEAQMVGIVRSNPYQQRPGPAAAAGSGQSFSGDTRNQNKDESMETRQQLLANLNEQIRASPYYRQGLMATGPVKQMTTSQTINKGMLTNDLDTYDSYHSEADPYKTFTTTSKMIRYPNSGASSNADGNNINDHYNSINPVGSGSTRIPANVDGNQSQTQQQHQQQHQEHQIVDNNQSGNQQTPQIIGNRTDSRIDSSRDLESNHRSEQPSNNNGNSVLTGPITNYDSSSGTTPASQDGDLMRNNNNNNNDDSSQDLGRPNLRVRREDSEDRADDADDDDDGVWVDDDEDDNKQQSSDVNETSQEPEEEDNQGQNDSDQNNPVVQISPPGVIGAPHGYELSPNDLMIYQG